MALGDGINHFLLQGNVVHSTPKHRLGEINLALK